jgi:tRNA A-37 threonylcarbamoyl transferase component Bud32
MEIPKKESGRHMPFFRHFFYWTLFACSIGSIVAELPNIQALERQKEAIRVDDRVLILGDKVTELDLSSIYRIKGSPKLALKISKITAQEEEATRSEHAPVDEEESALKDAGYLKHTFEYQHHRIYKISLIRGHLLDDILHELDVNQIKKLNHVMKKELKRLHKLGISGINIDFDSVLCHFHSKTVDVQFLDFEKTVLYYDDEAGEADFAESADDDEKQLRHLMKKAYKRAKKNQVEKKDQSKEHELLLRRVKSQGISVNGKLYQFGEKLGEGDDGIIYFAKNNHKVLLKVFRYYRRPKNKEDPPSERPVIDVELIGLKESKKLIYHYEEGPLNVIIYKYTPGDRLGDLLTENKIPGDLSKPSVQKLFLKAGHDAISRLHALNIYHGDTHLLNILFSVSHRGQVTGHVIDFSRSLIVKSFSKAKKMKLFRKDHANFNEKFKQRLQKWYETGKLTNRPNFDHSYFAVYDDV